MAVFLLPESHFGTVRKNELFCMKEVKNPGSQMNADHSSSTTPLPTNLQSAENCMFTICQVSLVSTTWLECIFIYVCMK